MQLYAEPRKALVDEEIEIIISELPPFGKVKLRANMQLPWAEKTKFESFACFTADAQGTLNLSTQKPDFGTYDFPDAMGLILSMKMVKGSLKDIVKNISTEKSLFIEITAEHGDKQVCATLERLYKKPEIKSQRITDGFVGEFFYTENTSNKTIVALGGSDGNMAALSIISAQLASHGFHVLSVAYFNETGLPKKLAEVPIEYFENVFQWLDQNPITKGNEIYVHGTSKGGELALLLASKYPVIKKVVGFAPHAYCFQGLSNQNVSSWTYGGNPFPFIRLKNRILYKNMLACFIRNIPFGYAHTYKTAVSTAQNKEAARIKIEHAKADLLLFAGKNDNIWNAADGCHEIMDTLTRCQYPQDYQFISYEDTGHPFPFPYTIPLSVTLRMKLFPRLVFETGGTIKGNAYAQKDSWAKTIAFFNS